MIVVGLPSVLSKLWTGGRFPSCQVRGLLSHELNLDRKRGSNWGTTKFLSLSFYCLGYIFCTSKGKPLGQSNILRRSLHPVLEKLRIKRSAFMPSVDFATR